MLAMYCSCSLQADGASVCLPVGTTGRGRTLQESHHDLHWTHTLMQRPHANATWQPMQHHSSTTAHHGSTGHWEPREPTASVHIWLNMGQDNIFGSILLFLISLLLNIEWFPVSPGEPLWHKPDCIYYYYYHKLTYLKQSEINNFHQCFCWINHFL
jgi:hypothetical protein